jgi:hypothetical protein
MLRGLVQQKILVNRNPNSTENNLKEAFFGEAEMPPSLQVWVCSQFWSLKFEFNQFGS